MLFLSTVAQGRTRTSVEKDRSSACSSPSSCRLACSPRPEAAEGAFAAPCLRCSGGGPLGGCGTSGAVWELALAEPDFLGGVAGLLAEPAAGCCTGCGGAGPGAAFAVCPTGSACEEEAPQGRKS